MKIVFTILIFLTGLSFAEAQTWSWSENQLFYEREGLSATVLDDSIFYTGGKAYGTYLNLIEIFDIGDDSWSMIELQSTARWQTTSVSAGGMVFIAGGSRLPDYVFYDEVDIYNKESGEWTVENLSESRTFIASVAHGNKVFFAGGASGTSTNVNYFDVIDIYDLETNTWSTKYLSVPRCLIGAAAAAGKVFFAGGSNELGSATDVIDIYDIENDDWTEEYLSEPRADVAAISYDNKVYFAGGALPDGISSDKVDIYNVENEEWEDIETLSEPRIVTALNLYDALIFTGHVDYIILNTWIWGYPNGVVDIYYPETDNWDFSIPDIFPPRMFYAYAAFDNKAYYAGGWKIEEIVNTISILEYATTGIGFSKDNFQDLVVNIYPNPFRTTVRIDYNLLHPDQVKISIYNNNSEQVDVILDEDQSQGNQQVIYDTKKLKPGIYYCLLQTKPTGAGQITKMIKL